MAECITIGLHEDLIQKLAELLLKGSKGSPDLSRSLCVFSNRRASLFLIRELSRQLGSSYFPPKMMIDDDLAEEVVRSHQVYSGLPAHESQYLIYRLAKKLVPSLVKKRPAFADFMSWAREISSFIEQLDLEAVDDKALSQLKTHARMGLDVPDSINRLLAGIGTIRKELHGEMEKRGQFSRGYIYLKAAELFEEKDIEAYDNIYLCNFFYMQKTEKQIFKKILKTGKAHLLFQGDQDDWPTLRENAAYFNLTIKPSSIIRHPSSVIRLYEASDSHAEAGIVKELMKKDGLSGPGTVVVLPKDDMLLPVVAQASPYMEGFNISLRYPLSRSSIYDLLLSVFKAQNSRKKNGQYYSKDYLEVLMHPVAKNWEEEIKSRDCRILVHGIEEALKGRSLSDVSGRLFVGLDQIENDAALGREGSKEALKPLHDVMFRNWEIISDFSGLAASAESFLDGAVKLGLLKSHPMNYAVAERLYDICDEMKNSSFSSEEFSKDEMFRIFDEIMSREKADFMGTPLRGVQVLGLFQTHSISFDNVIVVDANEGSLPNLRSSEPLIPAEAMSLVGLKRHERAEEIEKYQFRRLLSSAKTAHIIYRNDDRSERSRFVEELLLEREREQSTCLTGRQAVDSRQSTEQIITAAFNINPIPSKTPVKKTKQQADFLKHFEYSPTAVNAYLTCPAQFYYGYVLRLREQDDMLEELEGRDIGTFVHELLEDAYTPFKGQSPVIDDKFGEVLMASLERKFKHDLSKRIRSGSFMLRETLRAAVERFLRCERGRDIEKVLELEKRYKTKISAGGIEFVMKGTVDRIDLMRSGEIMVLDYKTGSSDIKPSTKIEAVVGAAGDRATIKNKIKSLQLPIYICLVSEKYGFDSLNPALYSIKDSELNSLWDAKHDASQRKELFEGYMSALRSLLLEIIDPSKDFEPDDSDSRICANCPYAGMCR